MKRFRSSEDLDSYGEKDSYPNPNRPISSHRSFYYKQDNARKGLLSSSSSSSRYDRDRSVEDDREGSRPARKRPEHELEGFDRRKGFDKYRDGSSGRGGGYGSGDRMMHRSESFCGPRRDFPKGFRSERDRSRRDGSVSSWRRFGSKELDEASRGSGRGGLEERATVRSPKGLRDVKSPTWSGTDYSRMRSPNGIQNFKSKSRSPTWSKDSGSERSKSVEVSKSVELSKSADISKSVEVSKNAEISRSVEVSANAGVSKSVEVDENADVSKSVVVSESFEVSESVEVKKNKEVQVESGGSSEMEEGEFEPEPEQAPEVGIRNEAQDQAGMSSDLKEVGSVCCDKGAGMEDEGKPLAEDERELNNENALEKENVVMEVNELPNCLNDRSGGDDVATDTVGGDEGSKKGECSRESGDSGEEVRRAPVVEESKQLEKENKEDEGVDLEVKTEDMEIMESNMNVDGNRMSLATTTAILSHDFMDKGKNVAVNPSDVGDSAADGVWVPRESGDALTTRDNDMEGPSSRGFELFSTSPVRKHENPESKGNKQKDGKLPLESLDLSLSLPNVLLPVGARDRNPAPGSPSQARSVQSLTNTFCTNSDGFTASMSLSGSQSFFHNPSCSLTQNSVDNHEQSVHSRPLFQGVEWQVLAQNESKQKEVLQRIMMNGNGSLAQSQALQGSSNCQAVQSQHPRVAEGSSKMPSGLDRQLSCHKQPSGQRRHSDVKSTSQSVGSHEMGSNYSFDKKGTMRESRSSLFRSTSLKEQHYQAGGTDFVETIIARILSEPIHAMARKFHEMAGQSIACLKENIRDVMLNPDKCAQLFAFQRALQNRSDITLEMLLKSHRAQLEILVALKTGISDFLLHDNGRPSSELAEIFLNLRCRNLTCASLLPVDECDCKVCVQKNGFCSACMCLVCSNFDMASNTCSWVGCDVCLHWCHADCGLQKSYIRNGLSATEAQGTTEMQFHCVACNHPSEMFGFVKEVFLNFAKEWSAETFSKELECIKRIFSGSKDIRGRQMYQIADQLLIRLANKSEVSEIHNYIMAFLKDGPKLANTSISSVKEHGKGSKGVAGPSQESAWLKSVYLEKSPSQGRTLASFNYDKQAVEPELLNRKKEPLFDELESIVRVKEAEAKMFQARADDARREAEGLKHIADAKSEKIEKDFKTRIAKLCVVETEELRKQKLENLQAMEKAHREYFNMKMRMETDIKDLLLKMEATKRNLAI